MILIVSGIQVDVEKKDIRNMRLYVKPPDGKVSVSAPLNMNLYVIEQFVHSKTNWIKKQIDKYKNHPSQSNKKNVTGDSFYLWGKPYILQINNGAKSSLKLSGKKAVLTIRKGSNAQTIENFIRDWYRKKIKMEISHLLPKWEKKTGLKCNSWTIRYMTSRWGSCKIKAGKICFNLQLAKKPPECLEYVILHELIHFVERYHNDSFKALLKKYMPNWRDIKALLDGRKETVP